jgi:hypothetical protein
MRSNIYQSATAYAATTMAEAMMAVLYEVSLRAN